MIKSILRATASPSEGTASCEGEETAWKVPSWEQEAFRNIGEPGGNWFPFSNEGLKRGEWKFMIEDWLLMISSVCIKPCMIEGEYPKGKAPVEKPCWQVGEVHLAGSDWSKLLESSWFMCLKASMEESQSPNIPVLGQLFGLQPWTGEELMSSSRMESM